MDAALLEDGVEGRGLGALRDKVLELDLGKGLARAKARNEATHLSAENVAGGPRLSEGEAMGLVGVLALKLAVDRTRGCECVIVSSDVQCATRSHARTSSP